MGSSCGKKIKKQITPYETIDRDTLLALIFKHLNYKELDVVGCEYKIYPIEELHEFLRGALPSVTDSRDPALTLLSREQNWFAGKRGPSTFGYISGDIRAPDDEHTPFLRSQNFYIDSYLTLWLIDHTTGKIYLPSPMSRCNLVLV